MRKIQRLIQQRKWLVIAAAVTGVFLAGSGVLRASGSWVQTTWSDGVGTSTTNQYSSASSVNTSAAGQIELSKTEHFTNRNFDTNLTNWSTSTTQKTPALVQARSTRVLAATSHSLSFNTNPTPGNTLVAVLSGQSAVDFSTPTDWTQDTYIKHAANNRVTAVYRKIATASESSTVTTASSGATTAQMDIMEFSGIASSPIDATTTNQTSGSDLVNSLAFGPTGQTTVAKQLALAYIGMHNSSTITSVWSDGFAQPSTSDANGYNGFVGYKMLSSQQAVSATASWVTTRQAQGGITTYKAADAVVATRDTSTTHGSSAGSAKLVTNGTAGNFTQSVNPGGTNKFKYEAYVSAGGGTVDSGVATFVINGSTVTPSYESVGSGWYKLSHSFTGVNAAGAYGIAVAANKTVYVDDVTMYDYAASGNLVSAIYDTGTASNWGVGSYTASGSGNTQVYVRTSDSSDMSTASDFAACSAITNGQDISGASSGCIADSRRYVQYKVVLSTNDTSQAPVFEDFTLAFTDADTTPPTDNASDVKAYTTQDKTKAIDEGDWTNATTPFIEWEAGQDNLGGSGIKGYCLYVGNDQGSDPVSTKGNLGDSPLDTDGACGFAVSAAYVNLATNGYLDVGLTSSDDPYYIAIKAIDSMNNVYAGSAEEFSFKVDSTPPTNPAYISAPSQFVSTKEVSLTWPTTGGDAAIDANSGVIGLQYRIGNSSSWYGDAHTGSGDFADLLDNDGEYSTVDPPDFDNIQEGNNVIYFRTWDVAGNVSTSNVTTVLKLNTVSPSSPQNIQATPSTNSTNSFAFSWNPPATYSGAPNSLQYCYTINTLPTVNTCTFTTAGVTSLPAGAFATQPGENTFYVVAKDEAGNINYATAGSTTFTANTSAPGIPLNIDVVDISVKATSNWRLALSWDEPNDTGAGVASYKIYRSTNNSSFNQVASTSGTSYVDGGLSEVTYYYKVTACDSANNCGAYTTTVSQKPTGKYTTPADLTSGPKVSGVSTRKASVAWTTDRESDSRIQYGLISGQYFATEAAISNQVTDHQIQLNNLTAGTTYYAKAKWTDADGNTGETSEFTFRTSPAPVVKEVTASPTLSNSIVRFTSKDASGVKVYYGKNEGFGGLERLNTSLSESKYSVTLNGLDDGSKYFYKINTLDEDNNEYEGNVYSFTTPARPQISNLRFQPVEDQPSSTQKITWNTNVAANSELSYGIGVPSQNVSNNSVGTSHEITISGLIDNSTYVLVARSRDAAGNVATSSQQVFKTDLDTRPPKVTDVVADASVRGTGAEARGQVVVSWKTDEPSTSQVAYGEGSTGALTSVTSEDAKLTTDHVVVVSDLSTSRVYHFEPRSYDRSRNEAKGDQRVAIIGRASENVLSIIFNALQQIFGIK